MTSPSDLFERKEFQFAMLPPCITMLLGATKSGKTHLLGQILKNFRNIFAKGTVVVRFVLVYAQFQPVYTQFVDDIKTHYPRCQTVIFQGFSDETVEKLKKPSFWENKNKNEMSILILDDVSKSLNKNADDFFDMLSHHSNISMLNIVSKYTVTCFYYSFIPGCPTVPCSSERCIEKCRLYNRNEKGTQPWSDQFVGSSVFQGKKQLFGSCTGPTYRFIYRRSFAQRVEHRKGYWRKSGKIS
jgi:hypothetical protein